MFIFATLTLLLNLIPPAQAGFGMGNPPPVREETTTKAADSQRNADDTTNAWIVWAGDPEGLRALLGALLTTLSDWALDSARVPWADQTGIE